MKKKDKKPWREIVPEYPPVFEFDEDGSQIVGMLEEIKYKVGQHDSMLYIVNVGGDRMAVWGSAALDERMKLVPVGCEVRITFTGMEVSPKTKRSYKAFTVEVSE